MFADAADITKKTLFLFRLQVIITFESELNCVLQVNTVFAGVADITKKKHSFCSD